MKKRFPVALAGILVAFFLFTFSVRAWSADKFVLRYASEYMNTHPTIVMAILPWMKEVKKLSGGRLDIQFYNPNTICPAKEAYPSLVAGVVDMVGSPCHWANNQFPLNNVISTPFTFNGAEAASLTAWDLYNKYPEWRNEYKDVKVLWQWASAVFQLNTTKKLVRTLEDIRGMKIIGINPISREILREIGAVPIEVTPQDAYLAMERGMAEGMLFPISPSRSFKISDVARYHTIIGADCDPFYGAMNLKKWESLPPDLKKILLDTTGTKLSRACGKSLDVGDIRDAKWMRERGDKFYVLPPAEKKRWVKRIKPLTDKWLKKMKEKGYTRAPQILEDTLKLAAKYAKTTQGGYMD